MGLRIFPTVFNHSGMRFGLSVAVVILLTATTSQAGFEWVPGDPKAAPAPVVETVPMEPPVLEPLMPSDDALSPMMMDKPAPVIKQVTPVMPQELQPVAKPVMKIHSMNPVPQDMKKEVSSATPPAPRKIMAVPAQESLKMPEPVVTETRVVMPVDAPVTARQNMPKAEVLKINPFPEDLTKIKPQNTQNEQSASSIPPDDEVVGFGNDMPLALALQQIAPSGYAFSFGDGVNPGSKVSWSGGKSWFDVMRDMIAPLNLKASVRDHSIFISHEQHSSITSQRPAIIEPASGGSVPAQNIEHPVRRKAIQDPGANPQAQPLGTLDLIEGHANEFAHAQDGTHVWEANKGDGLKQTLANWSRQGQFDVEWRAAHDFALESDVLVAGQIESAVQTLIKTGLSNEKAPSFTFVKNPENASKGRLIIGDMSSASAS